MDIVFGHIALVIAAAFAGAAIYVNAAEQPARLRLNDSALLAEWKPSYKRGYAMQASLALLGTLCGLAAWYDKEESGFLLGAILLFANWPWTLIAIRPTNNKLMAMNPAEQNPDARALIQIWGMLHAVRSALGAAATLALFFTCISVLQ
jgi:Domain of unknown function (DUF1772)